MSETPRRPGSKGYPARAIQIPEGCVLSNEQITAVLNHANARKVAGAPRSSFDGESPDSYVVRIPVSAAITKEEVIVGLTRLNDAKQAGDADVLFTFANGQMVKPGWTTLKPAPNWLPRRTRNTREQEF